MNNFIGKRKKKNPVIIEYDIEEKQRDNIINKR